MSHKLIQHCAIHQFFILLTFNALVHSTVFSPKEQVLIKPKPNGPQSAFKTCYHGRCQCKKQLVNCYMSDTHGAVALDISWEFEQDFVKLTCEGAPKDLDLLLSPVTYDFVNDATYFKLTNCLQLPTMLRRQNVSFAGNVEFNTHLLKVPEDLFWHTSELIKLQLNITTDNVANSLPPQLFQNLTALNDLDITVISTSAEVAVPSEIFQGLHALRRLSVYVYHAALGYYQISYTQHNLLSLRNLTSAHFRELGGLKSLLLDSNHLQTLSDTIFEPLHELNHLSLSLNELQQLPKNLFATQRKLVVLDLCMNALTNLPRGIFDNTPLLWKLLLSDNRFNVPTSIVENVKPLQYLYKLDLSNNKLTHIWGTGNYRNRTLLTRSQIKMPLEVDEFEAFVSSEEGAMNTKEINKTIINLNRNSISHFNLDWVTAVDIACPYELNLIQNNIKHIYAARKPPNTSRKCARRLRVQHNPLHCDCTLAWIYGSNLFWRSDLWTCATPANLKNKQLNRLQRADLCAWAPAFCPDRCNCSYDTSVLVVNCTGARLEVISQLPRPAQFALTNTTLHIEHNNFYELPANTTFGYANVTHIYAAHNRLAAILSSHIPPNLTVLDVSNNRLTRLSDSFLLNSLNESETLKELYLADNPWLCDCESEQLLRTVKAQQARIPDVTQLRCANFANAPLLNVTFAEICTTPFLFTNLLAPLIGVFSTAVVLLSVIALFYKYKMEVKIWLFGHNMFLWCINELELDKEKTFDAFISYAHQDQKYVNEVLLPGLELGRAPFRICTHERNWLAGTYIPEQIIESVEQSRRTIIVLSQHFIESDWGRMEFRTAHQCALNEGRARIIIIKYGELTNMERWDNELQAYLKLNTYLEWNDSRFWTKLRYAMPHKYGEVRKSGMLEVGRNVYQNNGLELNEM
ncbi:protein toll-like isoform X1 [Anastrepha ludens]|uniref:protein toll-like isoform X1 n=1 Tax=Anastrepha ludens TaxID=28586 RepID=UPI0023B1EA35|nr:protein toll-like isoform X1 [Anastrepha ludens]XP_053951327.1 protein toll-like isoform X1 [Anastrepha ludens]